MNINTRNRKDIDEPDDYTFKKKIEQHNRPLGISPQSHSKMNTNSTKKHSFALLNSHSDILESTQQAKCSSSFSPQSISITAWLLFLEQGAGWRNIRYNCGSKILSSMVTRRARIIHFEVTRKLNNQVLSLWKYH